MCPVRAALELRMILYADEEGMVIQFNRFNQPTVRRYPADNEPRVLQLLSVGVVKFVTVAMALRNRIFAVAFFHHRSRHNVARICAKSERTALVYFVVLAGHKVNDPMRGVFVEFTGVCAVEPGHIARNLDDRNLHAETKSQIG